jgi:hypothetical protein
MPTLTERIKELERHSEESRSAEIWSEFVKTAETNELAKSVVHGQSTFEKEYWSLFGQYRSRVFGPYSPPSPRDRIELLERCIGNSNLSRESYLTALENPLGMALIFGAGGAAVSSVAPRPADLPQVSRREFLIGASAFFAAFGGAVGLVLSYRTHQGLDTLKANATYLDSMLSMVLNKPNHPHTGK